MTTRETLTTLAGRAATLREATDAVEHALELLREIPFTEMHIAYGLQGLLAIDKLEGARSSASVLTRYAFEERNRRERQDG